MIVSNVNTEEEVSINHKIYQDILDQITNHQEFVYNSEKYLEKIILKHLNGNKWKLCVLTIDPRYKAIKLYESNICPFKTTANIPISDPNAFLEIETILDSADD